MPKMTLVRDRGYVQEIDVSPAEADAWLADQMIRSYKEGAKLPRPVLEFIPIVESSDDNEVRRAARIASANRSRFSNIEITPCIEGPAGGPMIKAILENN